jgi:hypothetical protein
MKLRNTVILLVLAAGMFAYIWFVDKKRPTTRQAMEHGRQVVELDRDKINTISIQNPEGRIELRKSDANVWQLEAPVKDRADSMVITQLLTSAETLKHDAVIGEESKGADKNQIKDFGVAKPETRIKFAGPEKTVELLIGKDAAVEGKVYARLEGSNTVYVISNDLKNQITKKADDFRDRKLTDLSATQIKKVAVKRGADELELEKKDQHWAIVKPLRARGDDSKIGDLVSQATTARIESFVSDSANLAAYGLQEPRGSVTLFTEGSGQPVVLQIGASPKEEKDKEKAYAKLSTRDSVVLLSKPVAQLLETKPNDLRDKNLVRFESDIVDRITIELAGGEKIVLARSGENWVRKADKDTPVNSAAATRLLDDLKGQPVANFVSDVATELAKYGLDQPSLRVTLSSFASENTAETKAGEKPIVTVLFGKAEGDNLYAKLDDEPFIVSVSKALVESIPTDPLQWQELTIYKFKPEEINSFEVTKPGQPAVSLERDKEKWKLSKGDGSVNQNNAQSLVNTLAGLRAVRWIGATKPEHGFDKPSLVVTFKTTGNTNGKLTVGATTPEEMSYAIADGLTGTFLISKPHLEAFQLALVDKPAPPAATSSPLPAAPAPAPAPGSAPTPSPSGAGSTPTPVPDNAPPKAVEVPTTQAPQPAKR